MTLLKDEILVAYADNELCAVHRHRFGLALADDENAIDTVVKFTIIAEYTRQAINWPSPASRRSNPVPARECCNTVCRHVERVLSEPPSEPDALRNRDHALVDRASQTEDHRTPEWSMPMYDNLHGSKPNDEMLVAYSDGMLNAETEAAVARYLASDPVARAFVERLIRSRDLAKRAYGDAFSVAPSPALIKLIMSGGADQAKTARNVVPLFKRKPSYSSFALPMAACLAFVVGGLFSLEGSGRKTADPSIAAGPVGADTPVSKLLATKLTGDPLPVAGFNEGSTDELTVLSTFRDQAGRICREFEVIKTTPSNSTSAEGLACRSDSGTWHVEALRDTAGVSLQSETFAPAGGEQDRALRDVLKSLGAGPALPRDEEQELLRRGWMKSSE